jgi:hypothetical protein
MHEDHRIISEAHGEPLPAGRVGVRVSVRLSGHPSRRWSRDLAARLARELTGHRAVGHLRLNVNEIVQGDQIVLEGVEGQEAPELAAALQRAVDAANQAIADEPKRPGNVSQQEADAIASEVKVGKP